MGATTGEAVMFMSPLLAIPVIKERYLTMKTQLGIHTLGILASIGQMAQIVSYAV